MLDKIIFVGKSKLIEKRNIIRGEGTWKFHKGNGVSFLS